MRKFLLFTFIFFISAFAGGKNIELTWEKCTVDELKLPEEDFCTFCNQEDGDWKKYQIAEEYDDRFIEKKLKNPKEVAFYMQLLLRSINGGCYYDNPKPNDCPANEVILKNAYELLLNTNKQKFSNLQAFNSIQPVSYGQSEIPTFTRGKGINQETLKEICLDEYSATSDSAAAGGGGAGGGSGGTGAGGGSGGAGGGSGGTGAGGGSGGTAAGTLCVGCPPPLEETPEDPAQRQFREALEEANKRIAQLEQQQEENSREYAKRKNERDKGNQALVEDLDDCVNKKGEWEDLSSANERICGLLKRIHQRQNEIARTQDYNQQVQQQLWQAVQSRSMNAFSNYASIQQMRQPGFFNSPYPAQNLGFMDRINGMQKTIDSLQRTIDKNSITSKFDVLIGKMDTMISLNSRGVYNSDYFYRNYRKDLLGTQNQIQQALPRPDLR